MKGKATIILIFVSFFGIAVHSQKNDSLTVKRNHYSLSLGTGWSHYINSLEIGKDEARINSLGVSLKFFWEPEHRLSLGLETGFYRLYRVSSKSYSDISGQASMSAIPFLLTVRMRVVDHLYLSTGAGLALMLNKVSGIGQSVNSTIWSLSNYQFSASYLYPVSKFWGVGGEFKMLNFGKADDWVYSFQALCVLKL